MNRTVGSFLIGLSTASLFAGCAGDPGAASAAATLDGTGTVVTAQTIEALTTPGLVAASSNAAALVASRPAFLQASPSDAFVQTHAVSSSGLFYVPYERTYAGLPVVGGDFVLVIDGAGQLVYSSTALEHPIDIPSITPKLTQAAAETIATLRLRSVTRVEGTQLVVNALGPTARLAWESTVDGFGAHGISWLTVDVDAITGDVLREQEHVLYGTGTSAWNGPNPVTLNTTKSGSTFSMRDPTVTNLSCQDAANNTIFSGPDDAWGNGNPTVRETGCVDALFGAQTEARMLTQWLGRNAMDGAGGAWPIRVGLADVNAFYDGTQVQIGHNNANQWIGAIDVIAHEMAHGIDDHTPGGVSGGGTQEFVADTFGAATEWFANEPAPFDTPDFTVGEKINLVGSGPIRNMANPSALGDPNCFSSAIPTTEIHAAAGPGNHWFYLLAQGSNPTNGQPASPTCDGSTVIGLGVQNAIKIMYNAMLMKTTASSYPQYRIWTLWAAKFLFPNSCTEFVKIKNAWRSVAVLVQPSEPSCDDFSITTTLSSQTVTAGTSATYTINTTVVAGAPQTISLSLSGLPAGVHGSFSPASVTAGGSSTLTLTSSVTAAAGTTSFTITGTGTAMSHTTNASVTVAADPPPIVTITAPTSGSTVSGVVTATASASDADGVTSVEFDMPDGTIIIDPSPPFSALWDSTNVPDGTGYVIYAIATDSRGAISVATVPVTVGNCIDRTFSATDVPVAITGNGSATSSIQVTGSGIVDSLVLSFDITHVQGDRLNVTLISPTGAEVPIILAGLPASFQFMNPVAVPADQVAAGDWTLRVESLSSLDTGTLDSWSMTIVGACASTAHWVGTASPSLPTIDNGTACSSLTVAPTGGDSSLAMLDVFGHHDSRSILTGTLAHNGTTVTAFSTNSFNGGGGTFTFTNHPVAGLSGDPSGTWTLCIIDTNASGDSGVLTAWSVHD